MTTTRAFPIVMTVAFSAALAACGGPPPAVDGTSCVTGMECASGVCADVAGDGFQRCGTPCTGAGTPCGTPGTGNVCRETGYCAQPCYDSSPDSHGNLCVSGVRVACTTLAAADFCTRCGCAPFGGGVCIAGTGCMEPSPDGAPCTLDVLCTSGTCTVAGTCGAAVAQGMPCARDAQCTTHNCSTDGAAGATGHCNAQLAHACTGTTDCTYCITGFTGSYCSRHDCVAGVAECPSGWGCERGSDAGHHCYETCDPMRISDSCINSADYCHADGLCY